MILCSHEGKKNARTRERIYRMRYEIEVVAVAGTNPLTTAPQPERRETVVVEAESLQKARNLVPVFMKMSVQGQLLEFYHKGEKI